MRNNNDIIEQVSEWKQIEMENTSYHHETEYAHQQDDVPHHERAINHIAENKAGTNGYCCAFCEFCL